MHIIIILSRIEDKYVPLNKGQVKEITVRALTENENNESDYFHFRYNLHKTSYERSSWWHFEYVGKNL